MHFPLSSYDITLWLAITAIILLATSELISQYYGKTNLIIDKNRLRLVAIGVSVTFFISILLQLT
jgi:hypothetical protein